MGFEERETKRSRSVVGSMVSSKSTESKEKIPRTYTLTPDIVKRLKIRAATEERELSDVVQAALEAYLGDD